VPVKVLFLIYRVLSHPVLSDDCVSDRLLPRNLQISEAHVSVAQKVATLAIRRVSESYDLFRYRKDLWIINRHKVDL